MKISLNWLQEYLPGPLDHHTAAEALTHGGLPVENFEQQGDDTVIDVEVTSNRSDCLSHVGVARELSALLNRDFRDVPAGFNESPSPQPAVSVTIEAADLCPHYTARVLQNVKIAPSPPWLARRLEAVGVRPINNVVDVTNYVLFEMGQPLHAFDFDRMEGGRVIVRRAKQGEKLVTIDGRERELNPEMLAIADAVRPAALAGVMGGHDSEVRERTVNILLESARFDPLSIRKTARGLAMGSDSSYRFERGIDPELPRKASGRAAALILQIAGGRALGGVAEAGASGWAPKKLSLRLARLKQVLGIDLPTSEVVDALRRDHLNPVLRNDHVECSIPSYRLDLNIEVDLIEEVARIAGYDKVPVRDEIAIRLTQADPGAAAVEAIRSTLVAGGYFESVTFSFVSDALAHEFIPAEASKTKPLMRAEHSVRKADAHLRPSILPGLLESVRHNESAGVAEPRLFEIGSTFWNDSAAKPVERRCVALVGAGELSGVRGVIETTLSRLNSTKSVKVIPDIRAGFSRGACGRIEWGGQAIGFLGKVDRAVAEKISLRETPSAAELELEPLLAGMLATPQLAPLPKFPAIRRDLSLVVPEPTRFEKIESLIHGQNPPNMQELQYVTTYRGKPLEKGQKSVTVTLVFRSPIQTLTSDVVDAAVQRVVDAAKKQGWIQRV
ncbi:MAG TPA: phenylalanine--tRNA ligase subunit beta [Tepidisphaeraceae bacterium]|nr:phenylalanine--tRNA ligase subunit beta [Tepidisphaeraceae bacterium]